MTEFNPAPSELTRKRLRMAEREEVREARKERLGAWLESNPGQITLIGALIVVLGIGAALAHLLGN